MKKFTSSLRKFGSNPTNLRYLALVFNALVCVLIMQKLASIPKLSKWLVFALVATVFALMTAIFFTAIRMISQKSSSAIAESAKRENLSVAAENVSFPIAVFSTLTGEYRASNKAFRQMKKDLGIRGKMFSEYTGGVKINEFLKEENVNGLASDVCGHPYLIRLTLDFSDNENRVITEWHDRSEISALEAVNRDEETLVAFVVIDNLDELIQVADENFGSAAADVARLLGEWAQSVGGIIKEYAHDKYIFLFKAKHLQEFIANKFSILDEVKRIKVGASTFPVTISIGVSEVGETLADKERNAKAALDMALARGGDQAVLKTESKSEIFGGFTKAVQSRNTVKSRTVALALQEHIRRSPNVLIMGHRFADYDAFGACVGIARLCMSIGTPCNIVSNKSDPNLAKCFEKIALVPGGAYDDVFVSAAEGQDLINPETLLVIVDVNAPTQLESKEIADAVRKVVYIDHHSQTGEFSKQPLIYNIDPTASSACELVCEILECVLPSGKLSQPEADLMYAGIVLDTKRFALNTGMRTFLEAYYLRDEGASPIAVQEFFKDSITDIVRETKFSKVTSLHGGEIAIAVNDASDNTEADRIMAAKFADKLLMAEGVKASFAVVRIGSSIRISGRSTGTINVRMILEKLRGGGHYDQAATQISDMTLEESYEKLIEAINEYYADNVSAQEN